MRVGAFSISLKVKDIKSSVAFYEKLGFTPFFGNIEELWLIMKNENAVIGLFQDGITENMMTFNPGWTQNMGEIPSGKWENIEKIAAKLEAAGIATNLHVEESGQGYFLIKDPDGNVILFDQHRTH